MLFYCWIVSSLSLNLRAASPPHFQLMASLTISVKKAIRSILLQEDLFCLPLSPLHLSPHTLVSLLPLGTNRLWNREGQSLMCTPDLFPGRPPKDKSRQFLPPNSPTSRIASFPLSTKLVCQHANILLFPPSQKQNTHWTSPFRDHLIPLINIRTSLAWKRAVHSWLPFPFLPFSPEHIPSMPLPFPLCENCAWQYLVTSREGQWSFLSPDLAGPVCNVWHCWWPVIPPGQNVFTYFPGPQNP